MPALEKKLLGIGKKPAMVVVDAIVGFTDPSCGLGSDYDSEVAAIAKLLAKFRDMGAPVYFTTVIYSNKDQASVWRAKLPGLDVLEEGSKWVEVDPRLAPRPSERLVVKRWASAFFETDLKERLRAQGVDTVFIVGFTTSGCVRASGVDSLQCNFRTIVVEDACGDRDPPAHKANLYDLGAKYADLVSLDEALEMLGTIAVAA